MTLFDTADDGGADDGGLDLRTVPGLLALKALPGIGDVKAITLARELGTWRRLQEAQPELLHSLVGRAGVALRGLPEPVVADHAVDDVRTVGYFDDEFPPALKQIPSPPAVLWIRGSLPVARSIALVGTRHPTAFGLSVTDQVSRGAAEHAVGIVSGLAIGIDTAAHRGALDYETPTWAVLGSGVDVPSPDVNRPLAEELLVAGGGLIAEVPPGSKPSSRALVARDRLQSGLAFAVVIAQSAIPSGTLHTARFALEQKRLLVVARPRPELQAEPESAGNLALTDPAGCDPSVLNAKASLAAHIQSRRPVADLVLNSHADIARIWGAVERWTKFGDMSSI
jgi:DNA processing protein